MAEQYLSFNEVQQKLRAHGVPLSRAQLYRKIDLIEQAGVAGVGRIPGVHTKYLFKLSEFPAVLQWFMRGHKVHIESLWQQLATAEDEFQRALKKRELAAQAYVDAIEQGAQHEAATARLTQH